MKGFIYILDFESGTLYEHDCSDDNTDNCEEILYNLGFKDSQISWMYSEEKLNVVIV